jgi:hypothetical protein
LFVGPGEKAVYVGIDGKALWVWRKFRSRANEEGVTNACFRNLSHRLSSDLIREATALGWVRWPGERFYTYVDVEATARRRSKRNEPGHCYLKAGWWPSIPEWTAEGKRILEVRP